MSNQRFPGHRTLGADSAKWGNQTEGSRVWGLLSMLEEESLGRWCADIELGRGIEAEAFLVPLVCAILSRCQGQDGNSDRL